VALLLLRAVAVADPAALRLRMRGRSGMTVDLDIATESTWRLVDLSDALTGTDIDPPTMWKRTDGRHLIYAGRVHWFQGESESCKSWAAQVIAADCLKACEHVLYIDFEDDDRGVVARFRALGVTVDQIAAFLHYLRPDEALHDRQGRVTPGGLDLGDVLESGPFQLAIVDGVTEAMTIEGLELISNADVARWIRMLPKRIAALGAAVIVIDHVTKDTFTQGRYAIGGQHKLAGTTGAAYRFTIVRPLSRATGIDPVDAVVAVTVMKDRPGHVRGHAPDGKVGVLQLTAWPDGGVSACLAPPGEEGVDPGLVGRILGYLADYDGSSTNQVEKGIEGKATAIRDALRWLADPDRAWVTIERKGQAHLHWLTDEGREELKEAGTR
jgi:hypothetical protein